MEGKPMIPAQGCLSNADYGKASHFRLGWDSHPGNDTVVSPFQTDHPPKWGDFRRPPVPVDRGSGIFNEDLQAWDPRTETSISYQAKPLGRRAPIRPTLIKEIIRVDPREPRAIPLMTDCYRWPEDTPHPPKITPDKWYTNIQLGDDPSLNASLYRESYQDRPEFLPPVMRGHNQHLGADKVLIGDRRQRFETTHQAEFAGDYPTNCRPPPQTFKERESSIEMGNQWQRGHISEQKWAYMPKPPVGPRTFFMGSYDRAEAARRRQMTTMKLGDGKLRLTPTMASHYLWNKTEPHQVYKGNDFESSIPEWDLNPSKEKYMTTYHVFHQKPPAEESVRWTPSDSQKGLPLCITVPGQPLSSNTSHKSEFQPPPAGIRKAEPAIRDVWNNRIAFEIPAKVPVTTTTTHDMLQVHDLPNDNKLPEEDLVKLKSCHVTQTWDDQRWFNTEHKDNFTNKYSGPIVLEKMELQKSSIPLGTMKHYHRELTGRPRPVPRKT